jgi:hypothetical protein
MGDKFTVTDAASTGDSGTVIDSNDKMMMSKIARDFLPTLIFPPYSYTFIISASSKLAYYTT